jgi:hypothetical protein
VFLQSVHTQISSRSGHFTRIRICANTPATGSGLPVSVYSDRPDIIAVPEAVHIDRGDTCTVAVVPVHATTRATPVTISAYDGVHSADSTTLVRPQLPYLRVQSVSRAGGQSRVTVCATSSGTIVQLSSSQPALFPLPAQVTIAAGHICRAVIVTVGDTAQPVDVTVTATFGSQVLTGVTRVRRIGSGTAESADDTITSTATVPAAAPSTATPPAIETPAESSTATEAPSPTPPAADASPSP